ncbi:hypothetical protein BGX28_004057 [Mortierella sp. GBA30]|nr:hypothetical protein BGX28_004057 [Mortierella sp. GBA30]
MLTISYDFTIQMPGIPIAFKQMNDSIKDQIQKLRVRIEHAQASIERYNTLIDKTGKFDYQDDDSVKNLMANLVQLKAMEMRWVMEHGEELKAMEDRMTLLESRLEQ